MKYEVKNKFKIREYAGGAYVFIAVVEGSIPLIKKEALLGDAVIEQWYEIPGKNEIAFRLKNEKDLENIKIGQLLEIKNPQ
jgi:hypothetical protein